MTSVVSSHMQAAIGSQISRHESFPVSASDIRRWATAIYWPQPPPERYISPDESKIVAPEDLNPFAWAVASAELSSTATGLSANDPDFTEKQLGIAGPGLTRQLNGGLVIEYGAAMRVGDVITGVRTLSGYEEREGRLGHMLFTTTTDTWTNQRSEFVKRTGLTLIRY